MIRISDEKLKIAARMWLETPGLSWAEIARSIDPDLLGQNLSRKCAYKGLIKRPARNHTRCQHCKRIRRNSSFCTVSERRRHCNDCRDYFSQRQGAMRRLTDDELAQFKSGWDVIASNKAMKMWRVTCVQR